MSAAVDRVSLNLALAVLDPDITRSISIDYWPARGDSPTTIAVHVMSAPRDEAIAWICHLADRDGWEITRSRHAGNVHLHASGDAYAMRLKATVLVEARLGTYVPELDDEAVTA